MTEVRHIHNAYADDPDLRQAPAPDTLDRAGSERAWQEITSWPGYAPTPLVELPEMAKRLRIGALRYKDESERFGLNSFKALGGAYAVYRLLSAMTVGRGDDNPATSAQLMAGEFSEQMRTVTVCSATDGNHGRSVAWGARMFGCNCVIFVPSAVSDGRVRAIEQYGAVVIRVSGNYDETVRRAQAEADQNGWFVISDTSYEGYADVPRDIMQGYVVMASEAIAQAPDSCPPSHVFVQGGCGGLAAAVCTHYWRAFGAARPRFIVAEPLNADCICKSLQAGTPVSVEGNLETAMVGLSVGEVSLLAWEVLKYGVDDGLAVPDDRVAEAMRRLGEGEAGDASIVAGETAVAGLVALLYAAECDELRQALDIDETSVVQLFGTEGATDPELYAALTGRSADDVRAG
jgi:diaminopropionate ammonia-lyase